MHIFSATSDQLTVFNQLQNLFNDICR